MIVFAVIAAILIFSGLALTAFLQTDATQLARALKMAGPFVLALVGVVLLLLGRAAVGGGLISAALAWYAASRKGMSARRTPGRRSTVRTAALEMELDHDTGGLQGFVLAGHQEGKSLASLGLTELKALYQELSGDPESRQLLETYLDGRFPVWREDAQPDRNDGQRVAPGSGAMTKEEAYKVLGLEAGAAAADVRKAHRRLIQRLHPDLGGSSFLAARINEAKDVLLSDHH
ncbi:HPt (histidine-containing phosphotransfer) domain-containing protein [Aminobacter lissarensis]|uniref:HPt (Histidine-containing phosphotransfer) domain-containing protein n=1 Tax=Aminobacter carboxidus TaxID=376165 RepID=A0A8E2BBS2_9HYPH|nr:DnaJ domain-containing protein [Aminobacter lissarensis]MBB6465097.1 HPt (histidine-containing phosphotransfer) domain-containing protein [Aminobacter lissarensis]